MAFPTQPSRFTRADGSPIRVLVVEDEPSLTGLLSMAMRYEGWDVTTANSGAHAVHEAQATRPDVIVLDMRLSDFDGLEVMRQIRINQPTVRAFFLTAKDAASGRIAGLTAGGDDYVTKPFEPAEVLFRLRALVRRTHGHAHPVLKVGELSLDTHTQHVTLVGRPVSLTAQETRLLSYLMHASPRVVSRSELSEHVYDRDHEPDSNVIDVQVSRLRRKLGAWRIATLRGQGSRLLADEPSDS